jgi:hypothetical protein
MCEEMSSLNRIKARKLAQIAGIIISQIAALGPIARIRTRGMYHCLKTRLLQSEHYSSSESYNREITIDKNTREEALFWIRNIQRFNGQSISQIFSVLSSTSLLLCEPPPFTFTNIEFEISLDAYSVITDNRTQKNTVYALLNDTSVPLVDWNTFVWSYINSPIVVGGASILSGSRSIGTPPGLNNVLGIDNSGLIKTFSGSTAVSGASTNFNTSMINNFLLTSTNEIIGKIASITDQYNLNLYEITVTVVSSYSAFVIRPSRFFTNSSGYQTLGGVILSGNDTVVTSNFQNSSTIGTYNDINPSRSYINPVISSITYSLSTIFTS